MATLAAAFGMLGRFAGKFLTTALGWASSLLFGRVPRSRQIFVVLIMAGSAVWLVLVIGIALPSVGTFLLAAVPIPGWVDIGWVRLAMTLGALVLPMAIGLLGYLVPEPGNRPTGAAAARQIIRGYPLALAMSLVLVFLPAVALVRRLRSLSRRWSDAHVPVVAKPGGYDRIVDDLAAALASAGLRVSPRHAPSVLAIPGKLVARVGGGGVRALLPDHLIELVGERLEVGIYPSDIIISGARDERTRARAAILSRLATTSAHLTTSAEAQTLEDRLERLAGRTPPPSPSSLVEEFASIDQVLARLDIPAEEWDVLYRVRLQVERDFLARSGAGASSAGGGESASRAGSPSGTGLDAAARRMAPADDGSRPAWQQLVGIGALALIGLDVLLAVVEGLRGRRVHS